MDASVCIRFNNVSLDMSSVKWVKFKERGEQRQASATHEVAGGC